MWGVSQVKHLCALWNRDQLPCLFCLRVGHHFCKISLEQKKSKPRALSPSNSADFNPQIQSLCHPPAPFHHCAFNTHLFSRSRPSLILFADESVPCVPPTVPVLSSGSESWKRLAKNHQCTGIRKRKKKTNKHAVSLFKTHLIGINTRWILLSILVCVITNRALWCDGL